MNHEEILKKAIEKAIKNGWNEGWSVLNMWKYADEKTRSFWVQGQLQTDDGEPKFSYKGLIFSHQFAKAFWGESAMNKSKTDVMRHVAGPGEVAAYQYHLQEMVLEKDPIKYLEKFL